VGLGVGTLLSKIFGNEKLVRGTAIAFTASAFSYPQLIIHPLLRNAGYERTVSKAEMLRLNTEAVHVFKDRMPQKIDELTTLVSAEGKEDGIYYTYRLELPIDRLPSSEELKMKVKPALLQKTCNNNATHSALNEGDSLIYNYTDKLGIPLTSITIKKADCI
jgi:hypothetical protein